MAFGDSWTDFVPSVPFQLGRAAYNKGKGWFNTKNAPQMPANPYQGNWDGLIGQLTQQANGQGPSLAQGAYQSAHDQGVHDIQSMSRGGSSGAARRGVQAMGQMNTNMTQGLQNARLQEQMQAQQSLMGALQGAGNAWFQPQAVNLNAQLNSPSNGQQLLALLQQLTMAGGQVAGMAAGKPPGV